MAEFNTKEVRFDVWCPLCVYFDVNDTKGEEPCNGCMDISNRKNTTKPLEFKAKSVSTNKK